MAEGPSESFAVMVVESEPWAMASALGLMRIFAGLTVFNENPYWVRSGDHVNVTGAMQLFAIHDWVK